MINLFTISDIFGYEIQTNTLLNVVLLNTVRLIEILTQKIDDWT